MAVHVHYGQALLLVSSQWLELMMVQLSYFNLSRVYIWLLLLSQFIITVDTQEFTMLNNRCGMRLFLHPLLPVVTYLPVVSAFPCFTVQSDSLLGYILSQFHTNKTLWVLHYKIFHKYDYTVYMHLDHKESSNYRFSQNVNISVYSFGAPQSQWNKLVF